MKVSKSGIQAVMETIRRHRRFAISTHINPEGDALGSALGLASLLKRLGKQAIVATDGGVPKAFEFLPRVARVTARPSDHSAEVAITTDVPILSRLGCMAPRFQQTKVTVNIDHHVSNHRFGQVNWVDPKASAVGEMIYRLYKAFGVRPRREEARCLYVSIVTDTGSFRYRSTTPAVHRIAADLVETGVSPLRVAQDLYECHSPRDLQFLGAVLQGLKSTAGGKAAWLEIPRGLFQRFRPGSEIVDELVNYPRSVQTAEVAFVLRQPKADGKIRISFRSKGRVDVNLIARHFGGGGHKAASGCTFEGTLPQARRQVLSVVRKAVAAA